jgi:pSer/pThr/pTyr-binding forkhead associated (FHA) protein
VIADPISGGASLLYRTGSEQNFPLPDRPEILVGYAQGNDIVVPFEGVSRRHARISFDGKSYWIEDAGSANKTFVNGRRVIKKKRLEHLDVVTLGRRTDLIFVRKRLAPRRVTRRGILSAWLERLDGTEAGERREVPRGTMTIGRSAVNNIQTDNQLVSKIHARLERTATQLVLTDLHSANGTFVGSNRIQSCVLKDGDRFSLAGARSYRVRLEEGEIEMNAEEDPSGAAAASIPSLPTDWKTRIEWSPEERAAFGEAFRAAPSAQAAGPSVGAPPVGEPSAAPQAALSPENPAAVAASAQPGPAPVEAPSAAATGVEAPPQSPGEPVAGPAPLTGGAARGFLEGTGRVFPLTVGAHEVGRTASSAIQIDHPQISRRHAVIRVDEREIVVEDLGSSNGTFVNRERIRAPRALSDGDVVSFGDVGFKLRITPAA